MSRSLGHVTHVLLTRSRLCPRPKPGSSLHLHVLSTPPAFVLSQDQTLRESLAWFQSAGRRETPRPPVPLSDHGKLSSRVSLPRTPAGPLNLTGTDSSQAPHRQAEAPRIGVKPGRDHFLVARTAEFSKTVRPQGWGFHPAPVARRRSVALPNWAAKPLRTGESSAFGAS